MTIIKRSFIIIFCIVSAILLTLNLVTFFLFRYSITEQLLSSQKAIVSANNNLCKFFIQEINQLVYQYTSDEELGNLLDCEIGVDPLKDIQTKNSLNERIIYHLNAQAPLANNNFSVSLYLNPNLPVNDLFSASATIPGVSHLFSGSLVKDEKWYQYTLNHSSRQYIFVDEEKNSLCFSRKLQNSYMHNSYYKEGVGVWLGSLPLNRVSQFFSFTPITENSGFMLLNEHEEMLYQSETLSGLSGFHSFPMENISGETIKIGNQTFFYSSQKLDWGLQFLFLTPYRDISSRVNQMMIPYFICSLIFLIIGALFSFILSRGLSKPVIQLTRTIDEIKDTRTLDTVIFNVGGPLEIHRLSDSFINLIGRVNMLTEQVELSAEQRRLSELRALQAQINPHFVLNAMNAVNHMALMRGEDDIASTLDSIASLMRYSITNPDQLVSISTEIDNIREYISIYTLRFRQEIELRVTLDRPGDSLVIPKFTLQPLVENSIRHGITRRDKGIIIHIHAWYEDRNCIVEVTDNGKGADPEILNAFLRYEEVDLKVTHGFGIRNVNERLQLHSGSTGGLSYHNNHDGKLIARITIRQ